jgi:pimeloyl-ACP methyl ester carboxylesterase
VGTIARRILAEAPPRFALAGHSMGGYIAVEIVRQAPESVARLALINTQARPDTAEATERRRGMMARAKASGYRDVLDELFPGFVHPSRGEDVSLRQLVDDMADDVGVDGFIRQQTAVISRPDSLSMEMASNIPDAKLVILPHCGHMPQPEQPVATAAALVEWLEA